MRFSLLATALMSAAATTASTGTPSYRSALVDLHKSLITTRSISGTEEAVGDFLVDYLGDQGYNVVTQPLDSLDNTPNKEHRFNVVAWKGEDLKSPRVMVTSHIDVVPPHIEYDIEEGDLTKDTMIIGRGSVDAKGSVASMIIALEDLLSTHSISDEDAMFLFVAGEEIGGDGMRSFSQALMDGARMPNFKAAIFGEPTENKLACGHKGGLFCELTAHGVSGHSSYPCLGKSANEILIKALGKILEADLGSTDEYGNTTVNVGRLDGGVASNVIAEEAIAGMMIRIAIGPEDEGSDIVEKRILDIVNGVDGEAFDLECTQGYGSVGCNCDVSGFDTVVVNYGTDIHYLVGEHTRYLYGPGTIFVAHGANENLTLGDLEAAVEGYQKIILHELNNAPSEL